MYHRPPSKILALFLVIGTFMTSSFSMFPRHAFAQLGYYECNDGEDNDYDGLIDFHPGDPSGDPDCIDDYGTEYTYTPPTPPPPAPPVRQNILSADRLEYKIPGGYTFTVPDGVQKMKISVWGAGGGGGSGVKTSNHNTSGYGGGGGGYSESDVYVVPGDTYRVVVGKGGLWGEGGGNSEVSIDGTAIVGAGGGGGGVSIGGPGYSSKSGLLGLVAAIVIAVVVAVVTYGAFSGLASTLTSTVGASGGTTATVGSAALWTETSTIAAGTATTIGETVVLPAMEIAATPVAVGGATAGGIISASAALTTTIATVGQVSGFQAVNPLAAALVTRDPRKPGGIGGLDGLGLGAVPGGIGGGKGGTWTTPSSWAPVFGNGGDGYAGNVRQRGQNGGPYTESGGNPYASSGGLAAGPGGGAGGSRGRLGRAGRGHCGESGCYANQANWAKDGSFPGGGGGGADTGMDASPADTGGFGADGQVVVDFTRIAGPIPQCRDGVDNDGDYGIDNIDPQCHTDCDATNINSYDPDHNDEANAPGGASCAGGALKLSLSCPTTLATGQQGAFLASSTNTGIGTLTYVFDWNDGGTTQVTGTPSDTVNVPKGWATTGAKLVNVGLTDGSGGTATGSCTVNIISDAAPVGFLDAASCTSIDGWTYDPDTVPASNQAALYADTDPSLNGFSGTPLATITADGVRADVNAAMGVGGQHGYNFTTPGVLKDGGTHQVYVVGVNSDASNRANSSLLSNSPMSLSGCTGGSTECTDGIDNDGDGKIDAADPQCPPGGTGPGESGGGATDVCPNIAGNQPTVPAGMIQYPSGNCMPASNPDDIKVKVFKPGGNPGSSSTGSSLVISAGKPFQLGWINNLPSSFTCTAQPPTPAPDAATDWSAWTAVSDFSGTNSTPTIGTKSSTPAGTYTFGLTCTDGETTYNPKGTLRVITTTENEI